MSPAEWIPPCSACLHRSRAGVGIAAFALLLLIGPGMAAQQSEEVAPAGSGAVEAGDAPAPGSMGSPDAQPREGVEEIVVEGTGADDSLQDTAISGTRFDAQEMRSLRIQDIEDVADYTPNLEIATAFAASNPTIFIRGIGLKDYNANAAGAVGIYLDGINVEFPAIQLFQLFDTESVEVLRGPQGSLFGRNASAGAILIRSRRPGDSLAAEANFTYGNYNTVEIEGAFDVPLVPDVLLSRFAFTANFRDGITENKCANWNPQDYEQFQDRVIGQGANGGPPFRPTSWLVTPETIQAEYEKDRLAGNLPRGLRYSISSTENTKRRQRALDDAGLSHLTAIQLKKDDVCITASPGGVVLQPGDPGGPVGTFAADNVPQLADFQGLKRWTNNVKDWAARGVFVYQPPQIEGMEWVANVHGGQNLSDSRHLQGIQAESRRGRPGFDAALLDGFFNEALVAEQTGFEGLESLPGVDPRGGIPGDRASNPYLGYYNADGDELIDTWGVSVLGEWEREDYRLLSLTGYEWYDRLVEDEGDAAPVNTFPADWSDTSWQFSQEFRISGESPLDGPQYAWSAGLFFLYGNQEADNVFPDTRGFRIEQGFRYELYSGAPFLNGTFWITEALRVEAGVRYNYERKDFTLDSSSVSSASSVEEIAGQEQSETWDAPTGEFTIRYEPSWDALEAVGNEKLMLYAKYARGFKGGHFNAGLTIANNAKSQSLEPVEPEYIHAAEVGFKTDWWDGRIRLNVSGFRYWYEDMQVFDYANAEKELPFPKLLNADARVWGVEAELSLEPVDHLVIKPSFGWLDSKFGDFPVTTAFANPRGPPDVQNNNWKGNNTINSPEYNANAVVTYELFLNRWGALIPQYDFSYRSKVWFDPKNIDPISQPAYWLHNARLSYRFPNETVEVAFWVQNFLDKEYKVDSFDVTREYQTILEVWGDPRTYGVSVWYGF